jgi:INO80 complex subunit C
MQPTTNNSGSSTPAVASEAATTGGAQTPASGSEGSGVFSAGNIAHATKRLDRLVLERNQQAAMTGVAPSGPSMTVTYTNIESAPSLHPSSQRRYCDITGLSAPYTDPKSRLRYHNVEVFALIRQMGQTSSEQYLAARGAHTVLK